MLPTDPMNVALSRMPFASANLDAASSRAPASSELLIASACEEDSAEPFVPFAGVAFIICVMLNRGDAGGNIGRLACDGTK